MSFPWMPLHIGDYIGGTMHLSTVEHGAYLLLIMHYWQKGGLPSEDRNLASIVKLTADQWAEIRPTIAAFFEPGWKHDRIERELADACATHAKRSASGKRAAFARYKQRMPDASAADQPTHANLPKKDSSNSEKLEDETLHALILKALGSPTGFFEEGELNAQVVAYPNVDFERRLPEFWRWGVKREKSAEDIRAMWISKLKKEAGSTALVESSKAPAAQPSKELAQSRLVKADAGPLPKFLERSAPARSRATAA